MDQETALYIVTYFSKLLTEQERLAIKHTSSTIKLDLPNRRSNDSAVRVYKENGWLSSDENVTNLLQGGYDEFELRTAERIFKEHRNEVKLNLCPKCKKLARTPLAKQCRFCGHNWH